MEIIIRREKSASVVFSFVHFLDEYACILANFYEYLEDSGDMYLIYRWICMQIDRID